jgi:photosystem II stability/assembly factor-like uncharacterized protein
MRGMKPALGIVILTAVVAAMSSLAGKGLQWHVVTSGVDTNLRGLSVTPGRNGDRVWASGSNGVVLRSDEHRAGWKRISVPNGEALDFRSIQAFDENTAYVMSSGEGEKSRIYKTTDGGTNWSLQFTDQRAAFFLDALVCSAMKRCVALSDPVDGKFVIVATTDGEHWTELPSDRMPAALKDEGAFAASGTCLARGDTPEELYFVTGGPAARMFHSTDFGKTWAVTGTPLASGNASAGIFSIAIKGATAVIVGGDYKDPRRTEGVAAYSRDHGKTWTLAAQQPRGYRSAVAAISARTFVAAGPTGEDISVDAGAHWKPMDSIALNALSGNGAWAAGAKGTIAMMSVLTSREPE